jgi:protein O-GlcNAc transferase
MDPNARIYQALALQQEGKHDQAELLLLEQLREFPNDVAALYSMGTLEYRRGAFRLALGYMKRALLLRPDFAMAQQAGAAIERLIEANAQTDAGKLELTRPEQREAIRLQGEGRVAEARALFEAMTLEDPSDFISTYSLAVILALEGRTTEALGLLDRAESIRADFSPLHYTRGTLLQGQGLFEGALQAFDRAIALKPDNLEALNNRASLMQALERNYEALQSLLQALSYKPDDAKLLSNVGICFTTLKRHAAAVPYFDRLLALDPHYDYAAGYRFFAKLHACDWSDYDGHREEIAQGVAASARVVNPMAFCAMSDDPALQLRCAQLFASHRYAVGAQPLWSGEKYRHRKLRLGYMSPDFREHPVGHLMVGVIGGHDHARVETFAFSLGVDDGSNLRHRFKLAFDHFLDCKDKTSGEIARLIRALEIDVLIDLAGFTAGSRAEVFAMRPAPIQVNYLGYPSTMGASWMDYLLADEVVIPPGSEVHYQESVLRLPYCYLPIDETLHASPHTPTRDTFGLPKDGVVFCSFNHDYKINPPVWQVWMELLHEHPSSVLWLMKLNDDAMQNLKAKAHAFNVDPSRLIFATRVPGVEEHLARYRLADVFLDTTPYNAHSTATDVLRMGLPMVTLPGRTFASRVAASAIRHTHSADSVIADDITGYKAGAIEALHRRRSGTTASPPGGFPTAKEMAQAIEEAVIGLVPVVR